MNISSWKINDESVQLIENNRQLFTETSTYIFNKSESKYNGMENIVSNILTLYPNNTDTDNITVDFGITSMNHNKFQPVYNKIAYLEEKKYIYSLFSVILFLEDDDEPVIFTNITNNVYKYKKFETQDQLHLIYPRKGNFITFCGNQYFQSLSSKPAFIINIWEKNDKYYNDLSTIKMNTVLENIIVLSDEIKEIIVTDKELNESFYEELLYSNNLQLLFLNLQPFIPRDYHIFTFMKNKSTIAICNNIRQDIDNIIDSSNNIHVYHNRFLQRFSYSKIFNADICNWIVMEIENYTKSKSEDVWIESIYYKYIDIENISSIFKFILLSLQETILEKIKSVYNLNNNIEYDIASIRIIKNKTYSKLIKNDGFFSIFIMLSNNSYEIGICFEDGLQYILKQGDLLLFTKQNYFYSSNKDDLYELVVEANIK